MRSQTGCITCRKRRVKCDEKRPACTRCEKAARFCEGYADPWTTRRVVSGKADLLARPTSSFSALTRSTLNIEELGPDLEGDVASLFDHFVKYASRAIPMGYDACFWSRDVLSLAHKHKHVRLAMHALAGFHQAKLLGQPASRSTLTLYARAMQGLISQPPSSAQASQVAVAVTGIMFTWSEVLQDRSLTALQHFDALSSYIRRRLLLDTSEIDENQGAEVLSAQSAIVRAAHRIDMQISSIVSYPRVPMMMPSITGERTETLKLQQGHPSQVVASKTFSSTEIAAESLYLVGQEFFRVFHSDEVAPNLFHWPDGVPGYVRKSQRRLIAQLDAWNESFRKLLKSRNHSSISQMQRHVLSAQYSTFELLIASITFTSTDEFGAYDEVFRCVISSCEQVMLCREQTAAMNITCELGIAFPLYQTAIHCRDRAIRMRAIALLEKCTMEGPWRPVMATGAREKVVIEQELSSGIVPEGLFENGTIAELDGRVYGESLEDMETPESLWRFRLKEKEGQRRVILRRVVPNPSAEFQRGARVSLQ